MYEVRWTVTNYQSKTYVHQISQAKADEGIANHATISGGTLNAATWRYICQVPDSEALEDGKNLDDYVILDGSSDLFATEQMLPANLELVEHINQLDFQPTKQMQEPTDLFAHADGSIQTKLIKAKRRHFDTASSSFLAYLPLSFWNVIVNESNEYAERQKGKAITLQEMLRFFGILFYMTIVDKGEYSNYWGGQVEDEIFSLTTPSFGLDNLMTLKRFQYIRKNLSFRCKVSDAELKKDPVARIRPLLNMIKYTSTKYVVVGRNVAVDESSIACRSQFGRHLIVFNSSKPTGKFHFKIYACWCSTTWLKISFRLHCASDTEDRWKGVISNTAATDLNYRLQFSSAIRQIVLEVTQPLRKSNRVVNTDNLYTSVHLLLSLRDVGMYGRGTIRENSAHFPKAHMFAKKANEPRGSSPQGVSNTGQIVAASWMDGSAVNILSNADSSGMGEVTRLIGKERQTFPAPKCVAEYNKHMQGVDRLDQLRAKYSLADGHSMKKWHKKLAHAFIDIARVNAYVTKCLRVDLDAPATKTPRNPHRQFMIELATELITGKWSDTVPDDGMLYADDNLSTVSMSTAGSPSAPSLSPPPTAPCHFVLSKLQFPNASKGKRGCKVCLFEGRYLTMKTIYCKKHNVCLCTKTYPLDEQVASFGCSRADWTCWQKYHDFYLPRLVFNAYGRIMRSSSIFQARQARRKVQLDGAEPPTPTQPLSADVLSPDVDVQSPVDDIGGYQPFMTQDDPLQAGSPATLVLSPFDGARANAEQDSYADRTVLSSPHAGEEARSTTDIVSFTEFRSPGDVLSTTTSEDFGYTIQI